MVMKFLKNGWCKVNQKLNYVFFVTYEENKKQKHKSFSTFILLMCRTIDDFFTHLFVRDFISSKYGASKIQNTIPEQNEKEENEKERMK